MDEQLKIIITAQIDELKKQVTDAKQQIEDLAKKGESGGSKLGKAMAGAGKAVGVGLAAAGAAVVAAGAALGGLAESTREYRTEQAKLSAAFQTAGASAGLAKTTYNDLYRVLGDSGQATEAAQHLAKLTTEEKALSEWTNICQGVYATFGSSLPIESLTEAVNHSAKLGEVQGSLADALEWSGINVDEFNDQLFLCNSESERERLIRETLNGKYATAAAQYEETAGAIMDANTAQMQLTDAMAAMGAAVEPIMTLLKSGLAGALTELTPSIQLFAEGLQEMIAGTEGGAEKMKEGFAQITETATSLLLDTVDKIGEYAPLFIGLITELIPQLTGSILSAAPDIAQTAIELVVAAINGIASMLPEVARQAAEAIPAIIKALISAENIKALIDAGVNLLMSLVASIGVIIPILLDSLPELIESLILGLVSGQGALQNGALKMLGGIVDALIEIVPSVLTNLPKIILAIASGLTKAAPQMLQSTLEMFGGMFNALGQVPSKIAKFLDNIVKNVKTGLVDKLKSALTFDWKLPNIKMPNISVAWKDSPKWMAEAAKFIGLKGIPSFSVNWNALGGVFDKPTVFSYGGSLQGIGEDGAEAVVPLENNLGWLDKIAGMLSQRIGSTPVVLQVDNKVLARTTIGAINELTRQQGKLSLNLV